MIQLYARLAMALLVAVSAARWCCCTTIAAPPTVHTVASTDAAAPSCHHTPPSPTEAPTDDNSRDCGCDGHTLTLADTSLATTLIVSPAAIDAWALVMLPSLIDPSTAPDASLGARHDPPPLVPARSLRAQAILLTI